LISAPRCRRTGYRAARASAPQLREHAGEVLVRLEVRFHGDGVGAHLLGRLDEEILAHDSPVVVDVEHGQPLLAQLLDGVARHEWALARLRSDDAEAPRAARREVRMGGRRGQLHHPRAVVDRLGRQACRAAEVTDLGHDAAVRRELLRERRGLLGIGPAVANVDHDGTPLDAARRVDPLDAEIDGLLEQLPVLGEVARERGTEGDMDGLGAPRRPRSNEQEWHSQERADSEGPEGSFHIASSYSSVDG
jgi:hypothetical protein